MKFFQDQMFWAAILIYFIPLYSYCIYELKQGTSNQDLEWEWLVFFAGSCMYQDTWTICHIICWYLPLSSPTVHKHEKTLAVNIIDCVFSLCNKTCLYFHSRDHKSAHNHGNRRADRVRGRSDVSEGTTGEREVLPFD